MPTVNLSTLLSSTNLVGYTGSTGVIQGYSGSAGGAGIAGGLHISGTTLVTGNILPTSNNTVNLGAPDARFGTLYISANTIDIGGAQITSTEGDISFTTSAGNVALDANTVSFLSGVSSTGGVIGFTGSQGIAGPAGPEGITEAVNTAIDRNYVNYYLSSGIYVTLDKSVLANYQAPLHPSS